MACLPVPLSELLPGLALLFTTSMGVEILVGPFTGKKLLMLADLVYDLR